MKYEYYYIEDSNGKSNCVIRSLCKIFNLSYEEVYNELCNIQNKLNKDSYVDIEVFESYMRNKGMKELNISNIKVKDLKLDNNSYIVFCYNKKDWYHMIPIIDNTIYDKSNECLELEVIKIYILID